MDQGTVDPNQFIHVRMVLSMVVMPGHRSTAFWVCAVRSAPRAGKGEYDGFSGYFMSRRRWFFAILVLVLVLVLVLDVVDTWIKGTAYLHAQGGIYLARTIVGILLCGVATLANSQRFHLALVCGALAYQAWWILRLYDVLA